ncbi:MAG: Fe-S cluster assembly sulfur transfer protein SufU [Phycisphaerae bacterium]
MSDLRELYQEVILDHSKHPRNSRALPAANHHADGHNPLCGDRLKLYVQVDNGVISDIGFTGAGCAISTASASMMTEALKGKTVAQAEAVFQRFHHMLTGSPDEQPSEDEVEALGKLGAFAGVREFPVRVKCATLAWHTLQAALKDQPAPASTE